MSDLHDLATLGSYLEEFGATAPSTGGGAVAMDFGTSLSIQAVQHALNQKGYRGTTGQPLVEDGAQGPNTRYALARFVEAWKKQHPSAQAVPSTDTIYFLPAVLGNSLLETLRLDARGQQLLALHQTNTSGLRTGDRPLAPSGDATAIAGAEVMPAQNAQQILRGLGILVPSTGRWDADTTDGWLYAARTFRLPETYKVIGGDPFRAVVDVNTASTLRVKSRYTPASTVSMATVRARLRAPTATSHTAAPPRVAPVVAKPTTASRSGLTKVGVGTAQDILRALRVTLTRDGSFGPTTAGAWGRTALARKLRPEFDRAGPTEAWVDPTTLEALRAAVNAPTISAKPPSAKVPASSGLPMQPSKPGLTKHTVGAMQSILHAMGSRIVLDKKFGPATKASWASYSKLHKLDGVFDRASPTEAWVNEETYQSLHKVAYPTTRATGEKPEPAPAKKPGAVTTPASSSAAAKLAAAEATAATALIKLANVTVPVKLLQQAELIANLTGALRGKIPGVTESGVWSNTVENGFYTLFNYTGSSRNIWARAFKTLVAKDRKSVKLTPDRAQDVGLLAKAWQEHVRAAAKKAPGAPASSATPTRPKEAPVGGSTTTPAYLAALAKATVTLPVKTMQAAQQELYLQQRSGKVDPKPVLTATTTGGVWLPANVASFWLLWGTTVLPSNARESDKTSYLSRALSKDKKTIKVNTAVASLAQKLAAQYAARWQKPGGAITPVATGGAVPQQLPGQQAVTPGATQYITGQGPQQPTPAAPGSDPMYAPPMPMPSSSDMPGPQPIPAPMPGQPDITINASGGSSSAGGATLPGQPPPDASLTPGAPATPTAASSSGLGIFLGVLAVGAVAILAANKDEQGPTKGQVRPQMGRARR
jgi:hypothetical protein